MDYVQLERGIQHRLWVIGIPVQLRIEISRDVVNWVRNSGREWTVKRLKSLKVDLFRQRSGLPTLTWIRKNSKGGIRGYWGTLYKWSLKSDMNFRKGVQAFMCYSLFYQEKVTETQLLKFKEAVSSPPPAIGREFLEAFAGSLRTAFRRRVVDRMGDVSLLTYRGSASKSKPVGPLPNGMATRKQSQGVLLDSQILTQTLWGISLLKTFPTLYGPVTSDLDLVFPYMTPSQVPLVHEDLPVVGGKIGFIQEAGLKLRSVASPFVVHQLALRHFGDSVYRFVRDDVPWDCTHDQSKPIQVLQDHLSQGRTVHSVDLSSATDLFPLEIQLVAMKSLFGEIPDIHLFEVISRSIWRSPFGDIRWLRGQPLGLYPSFAVFTATHGLLLWYLNGCKWDEKSPPFYVLGDDVVILDDELHLRYIEILDKWAVKWSPEKTLSSSEISEFAGKVITASSVTPQLKWREFSNDSFVDLCRLLGPRSRTLLTREQRDVFDKIKHCSLPLGLNFSFPGSNLELMERKHQSLFGIGRDKVQESLMDLIPLMVHNYYDSVQRNPSSYPVFVKTNARTKAVTFDEKVMTVLRKIIPWFDSSRHHAEHFSGVPAAVSNRDLPLGSVPSSRLTTLDRYKVLLGT